MRRSRNPLYSPPMRRITTTDQDLLLEISPCTEEEVDDFTAGDCWKLAREIHLQGAGRLTGVVDEKDPSFWIHMVVELPDGNFLDVYGIQSREQLMERWAPYFGGSKPATTRYDLSQPGLWEELTGDQDFNLATPEEVTEVAQRLIEWSEDL